MTDDATTVKRRNRRPRKLHMTEAMRARGEEAKARLLRRRAHPGVRIVKTKAGYVWDTPYKERTNWHALLFEAFGTSSIGVVQSFMRQLDGLCQSHFKEGEWVPNESELIFALNVINSVRPRNELEAALAAQMCAVHFMTMGLAEGALGSSGRYVDGHRAQIAGKLARTFAIQIDALNKIKGRGGKQTIKVRYERHDHKHVHVERGGGEFLGQPQASVASEASRIIPALPGQDAERDALPRPGDQGKGTVQDARRTERRTKR